MLRLIVILFLLLTGCATAQTPPVPAVQASAPAATPAPATSLAAVTSADLDAAIATANANSDPVAANCFTVLKKYIGTEPTAPQVKGVFSAFEATRVRVNTLNKGVPQDLHIACAPVVLDAQNVLLKLGLIAAGKGLLPLP